MRRVVLMVLLGGCSAEMIELSFLSYEPLTGRALEGVETCDWPDAETCFQSDAQGMTVVEVEAGSEVYATHTFEGYYPRLSTFVAPEESASLGENAMATNATVDLLFGLMDVELQSGTGLLGVSVLEADRQTGVAGVRVTLDPPIPNATRTVTLDVDGSFSTEMEETAEPGAVGWFNVPPGEYVATFEAEGKECTRLFGLDAEQPNQIRFEIAAGHWTYADMLCE